MHTVNKMFDKYEKLRLPRLSPRTKGDYKRQIAKLRRIFGTRGVTSLTRKEIVEFMNVSESKIRRNRELAVLSATFREALGWGWVEGNPCNLIKRHKSEPNDRQLTEPEFEAAKTLAAGTRGGNWKTVLVMDLVRETGQFPNAILSLRWPQIDQKTGIILFRHTITHKKVPVTINPKINDLLELAKKHTAGSEFVITTGRTGTRFTDDGFRALWQRLMRKVGPDR